MPGKLIVFEGTDGSGKSTQFQALCARVEQTGTPFRRLVFPQYQEPSSASSACIWAGNSAPAQGM